MICLYSECCYLDQSTQYIFLHYWDTTTLFLECTSKYRVKNVPKQRATMATNIKILRVGKVRDKPRWRTPTFFYAPYVDTNIRVSQILQPLAMYSPIKPMGEGISTSKYEPPSSIHAYI